MSAAEKLLWLLAGAAALLAFATVVSLVLRRHATSEAARATVQNLHARIMAWWVMVAMLGVAAWLGAGATLLLFAAISFYALREFVSLTPTRGADNWPLVAAFYLFLPLQYWLIWIGWYGLFAILIPVYGFLVIPSLGALAGDPRDFLARIARTQWGLMLAVYCISHAPALLFLDLPGHEGGGFLLLFFLLIVVQMSDVLQYVFGKLLGRRKLAPVISPSKTVEGLLGGGGAAIALGTALWWITPFAPWQAALMSAAIVAMGVLGGLALSAMKRSLGAKDWGTMVSGHGGVLDRLDSVAFAAPVFFHLTRFFFAP
jgi:phosphatidate cytidylyltransferase